MDKLIEEMRRQDDVLTKMWHEVRKAKKKLDRHRVIRLKKHLEAEDRYDWALLKCFCDMKKGER